MRLPGLALPLLLLASLTATKATAQIFFPPVFYPPFGPTVPYQQPDPEDSPVEVGFYVGLGSAIEETPPPHSSVFTANAGIYAQWNRFGLCPGLDLRAQGNSDYLHGYLVGPRLAYQPRGHYRPLRPYVEALFGKNEINYSPPLTNTALNPISTPHTGVTRAIAVGLDLHPDSVLSWRVLEFTKGDFTGLPGSYPQTLTTGLVLHIP